MAALKCHGVHTVWISTGAVLPPPPVLVWIPGLLPAVSKSSWSWQNATQIPLP